MAKKNDNKNDTANDNRNRADNLNIGGDLKITKVERRDVGGTWVCGRLSGHRFEALVFHDHAEYPEYELGHSCISKLWLQRLADKQQVFYFDRGLDIPAANPTAQAIVDFLAGWLVDYVYG